MRKYLIISPHLDDAVISCGASIAEWASKGDDVLVATVFTSCGDNGDPVNQLYEQRRAHDQEALLRLGAEKRHLGFTDAPFRGKGYHNFSTILFHHQPVEDPLVAQINRALQTLIQEFSPDQLIFPLGIGGHVDHHLVYLNSLHASNGQGEISYYEDLPYAFVPGWLQIRLLKLGFETDEIANIATPDVNYSGNLENLGLPFLKSYIMDQKDLEDSNQLYQEELTFLQTAKRKQVVLSSVETKLDPENQSHFEEFFLKKCEAVQCYQTEWPALFGTAENIKSVLHPTYPTPYIERFWKKN